MWAIVQVVTSYLNHVVSACVMNQSRGHWLLLNALTIAIALPMNMKLSYCNFIVGLKSLTNLKSFIFCT